MKTHLHQPSVVIAKSTGRCVDVPTGSRSLSGEKTSLTSMSAWQQPKANTHIIGRAELNSQTLVVTAFYLNSIVAESNVNTVFGLKRLVAPLEITDLKDVLTEGFADLGAAA